MGCKLKNGGIDRHISSYLSFFCPLGDWASKPLEIRHNYIKGIKKQWNF